MEHPQIGHATCTTKAAFERCARLTPHRILGVPAGANGDQARAGFRDRLREHHPDKNGRAAPDVFTRHGLDDRDVVGVIVTAWESFRRTNGLWTPASGSAWRAALPSGRVHLRANLHLSYFDLSSGAVQRVPLTLFVDGNNPGPLRVRDVYNGLTGQVNENGTFELEYETRLPNGRRYGSTQRQRLLGRIEPDGRLTVSEGQIQRWTRTWNRPDAGTTLHLDDVASGQLGQVR